MPTHMRSAGCRRPFRLNGLSAQTTQGLPAPGLTRRLVRAWPKRGRLLVCHLVGCSCAVPTGPYDG